MIKATCPCGGTFETSTGSSAEGTRMIEWLNRHQKCVEAHIKKSTTMFYRDGLVKWPSGFDFTAYEDNMNDKDQYAPMPVDPAAVILRKALDQFARTNDLDEIKKAAPNHWAVEAVDYFYDGV